MGLYVFEMPESLREVFVAKVKDHNFSNDGIVKAKIYSFDHEVQTVKNTKIVIFKLYLQCPKYMQWYFRGYLDGLLEISLSKKASVYYPDHKAALEAFNAITESEK